ncbi:sorting nexin-8-like isoform X2 [Toxorhynchites rutilus septentrionalis]|uniref:sorting nexin-8-like isoform X2 n=1 Tax=Toxorhynchites rutilus septentrionalis TaxID=329112 RepID=UPI00247AC0AC|nr:sorting nexin-8-like isoform X2 [Toxorhynchites rutilus septentrionalis]
MSVMVEASPVVIVMSSRDILSDSTSPNRQHLSEAHIELDDSRFDNNLNPNIDIDLSRSPSVGETFVSAATNGPLSSSDSSDTDSSDDEVDQLGGKPLRSSSLNSHHNSATAFDQVSSLSLEKRPLSPGEGPSGSTSISMSIGSMGDDSGERSNSEPCIVVTVVPERKGIFLKHSEYEVKTRAYDTIVRRRYRDFIALFNYLIEKYPYRMIPDLPPKQLMLDTQLEERRRGLQTWLTIISMHPVLGTSPILITFLSDKTQDYQYRMRVMYEKQVDEFSRLRDDVDLPLEDQEKLAASRDRLRKILHSLQRLRKIFDEQAYRIEQQARDMAEVDLILQNLDVRQVYGEKTFDGMSHSVQTVAEQSERYVQLQRNAVNERIHVLMDVLAAHNELCDRVEKGVFAEYQRALSKSINISRMKMKSVIRGTAADNMSTLAQRETVQCGEANTLGRKCAFGLQCVRSETILAEKYLLSLPSILLSYAREESQYHSKMSKIWHQLVANESSKNNANV